jgi:hypothetical protein
MIQRIQTLLFLAAAICFTAACFMPIGTITTYDTYYVLTSWVLKENIPNGAILQQTYFIGILQVFLAIISFVAIFFYAKRPTQSKICVAALVLNCLLLLLMLWYYPDNVIAKVLRIGSGEVRYSLWVLLSFFTAPCLYFANKFIIKDEKKLRAADRLR